jgi:hypothetical protein
MYFNRFVPHGLDGTSQIDPSAQNQSEEPPGALLEGVVEGLLAGEANWGRRSADIAGSPPFGRRRRPGLRARLSSAKAKTTRRFPGG